jgi:hypothetical protein
MKKHVLSYLSIIALSSACSSGQSPNNSSNNLPSVNPNAANGQVYIKAKAEFDLSSAPDGSAQFNLVKKSYAAAPNCLHGQCTDYSDITVTNSGSTQFELAQSQAQIAQNVTNQNLSNIVDLKIATLFDNNLTSCGGQKCTAAAIRIYTNDSTGVQGQGLYSSLIGKSVPLTVSGGSAALSLAAIPYFNSANPDDGSSLQIDLDPLAADKNVLSLAMADFADAASAGAGYTLSADFTQAGAGTYKAHVVVEYDLIGPPSAPPQTILAQGLDWGMSSPNVISVSASSVLDSVQSTGLVATVTPTSTNCSVNFSFAWDSSQGDPLNQSEYTIFLRVTNHNGPANIVYAGDITALTLTLPNIETPQIVSIPINSSTVGNFPGLSDSSGTYEFLVETTVAAFSDPQDWSITCQ